MRDALTAWEAKGGPLPEALQKVVNKRIGRLTAERETATQRADKAEAELKRVTAEAEALRNDPNRPGVTTVPAQDEKVLRQTAAPSR